MAGIEVHGGGHGIAGEGVVDREHRGLSYRWMGFEPVLHFGRRDVLGVDEDQVSGPRVDVQQVAVEPPDVAQVEPAVPDEHLFGGHRVVPVAEHDIGAPDMDPALLLVGDRGTGGVSELDLGGDGGPAGCGGVELVFGSADAGDDGAGFGAGVAHPQSFFAEGNVGADRVLGGGADGRAADADLADAARVVVGECRSCRHSWPGTAQARATS